jgi:geranylgeranyl pyrophosphate synthase
LLSNLHKTQYNNFSNLAKLLGLLYQMIDDYLDATSNKTILGKNPGNDLNTKKITYFSLYGQKRLKAIIEINFKEIARLAKNLKLPTEFTFLITEIYGRIE